MGTGRFTPIPHFFSINLCGLLDLGMLFVIWTIILVQKELIGSIVAFINIENLDEQSRNLEQSDHVIGTCEQIPPPLHFIILKSRLIIVEFPKLSGRIIVVEWPSRVINLLLV